MSSVARDRARARPMMTKTRRAFRLFLRLRLPHGELVVRLRAHPHEDRPHDRAERLVQNRERVKRARAERAARPVAVLEPAAEIAPDVKEDPVRERDLEQEDERPDRGRHGLSFGAGVLGCARRRVGPTRQ